MKFENDKKYLRFRTILIVVTVFLFFYISNKILKQKFSINIDNLTLYLIIFVFTISSLFFLVHSIYLINRLLIFKNIFGFTLKKIELDSLKGRKIIYKNLPYKAISIIKILGLFGDKYESSIEIKISLKDEKKYNFNGQILSNLGLKSLNEKIK
ncbi:hypothetical protein [Flavobacterium sp.]|uniref:hypothetical protein n=1 Tax=Flavobacterium sp. TaxID=239 RepID=UPI002B4ABAA1|nr:hypothetical protein [Flavobacterium sp.]HLP65090.1 hypothetical protein [Flavobacterium sp.]